MDVNDYIVPIVSAVSGGLGGWLFGRKKQNAETELIEGSALQSMQEAYRAMVVDTNEKLEEQSKRIDKLRNDLENCKAVNKQTTKELFLKEYAAKEFGLLIIRYDGTIEYTNDAFDKYFGVHYGYFLNNHYENYLIKKLHKEVAEVWDDSKHDKELRDYKTKWKVEGKLHNCHWVKSYNDNFSKVTFAVLKV